MSAIKANKQQIGLDILPSKNVVLSTNTSGELIVSQGNHDNIVSEMAKMGNQYLKVPSGTTSERPSSPVEGMIRYNETNGRIEGYDGGTWGGIRNDVVSVKDFGAIGDGVTDDTAAIQAAIDYCETTKQALHIPAGIYLVTTLTVKGRGRKIFGDGVRASVLKGAGANDILVWGRVSVDVNGYCDSGVLRDIGIEGNELSTGGLVVPGAVDDNPTWAIASRYNAFDNIMIRFIGNGPAIRNSAWGNGYTNVVTFTNKQGLLIGSTSYSVTFTNCTFSGCEDEAIFIPDVGADPILFVGCVAQDSGGSNAMVDVRGGRGIEFIGLYTEKIKSGTLSAVRVGANCDGFSIRGMRYSVNDSPVTNADVIFVDGCDSVLIENVSVRDTSSCNSVIRVQGAFVGVTYSCINGIGTSGTILDESTGGSVFGNDIVTGEMKYNKRLAMPGFITIPNEISIPDDSVYVLEFDLAGSRGILALNSTASGGKHAIVVFRTGDASRFTTLLAGDVGVDVANSGALTGTTGVDGNLTISTSSTVPKVYIENRTGVQRNYSVTLLGNHRGVLV